MRKSKIIETASGKPVTIYEARVGDVKKIWDQGQDMNVMAQEYLELFTSLGPDDILDLYPSDLEKVWEGFKELNSFFFKILDLAGIQNEVLRVVQTIAGTLSSQFVALFVAAMGKSSTTDTGSSS